MKLQGLLLPQTEHPEGEKEIFFGFTSIPHLHFLTNKGILLRKKRKYRKGGTRIHQTESKLGKIQSPQERAIY